MELTLEKLQNFHTAGTINPANLLRNDTSSWLLPRERSVTKGTQGRQAVASRYCWGTIQNWYEHIHQWRGAWAQCVLTLVIQLNYEASLWGRKSAQDK